MRVSYPHSSFKTHLLQLKHFGSGKADMKLFGKRQSFMTSFVMSFPYNVPRMHIISFSGVCLYKRAK